MKIKMKKFTSAEEVVTMKCSVNKTDRPQGDKRTSCFSNILKHMNTSNSKTPPISD